MKAICTPRDQDIIYRLTDYDPLYEQAFSMCFYQQDEHGWFKRFPASLRYTAKIIKCFERYAPQMFDQLLYREIVPWEDALQAFCERVFGSGLDWWLTGSAAACIRGIDLMPHDVDIIINSKHCIMIDDLFADEWIEPLRDTSGWVTKDFGVIFLKARIDIASDPLPQIDLPTPSDCGPLAQSQLEAVNWRGFEIRVPPLYLQAMVNRKRGREERAFAIEKAIT